MTTTSDPAPAATRADADVDLDASVAVDVDADAGATGQLRAYMGGQLGWYATWGVQMLLFPYLVVIELGAPAERVGLAQMSLMLPSMLFILVGGMLADRSDLRTLLVRIQLLALIPPAALFGILLTDNLSFPVLIVYGLAMGTASAFVMPARDSLLTTVARGRIQQAVSLATALQFGGQVAGLALGGAAEALTPAGMLAVLGAILLATIAVTLRLKPVPPGGDAPGAATRMQRIMQRIKEGISEVARSERMAPVVILMIGIGLCYMGWFMVNLPLIIRDIYGGGAADLAAASIAFQSGVVVSTILLLRYSRIEREGRALMIAIAGGIALLFIIHFDLTQPVFYVVVFLFGAGAGVAMSMGRTIVQEAAPESHRARILSVYQLAFMGAAPVGALAMGYITSAIGPLNAALVPVGLMSLLLAVLFFTSRLWHLGRHIPLAPPAP